MRVFGKILAFRLMVPLAILLGIIACQPGQSTYSVGIISQTTLLASVIDGFKLDMSELGYVDGKNVNYLYTEPTEIDDIKAEIQRFMDQNVDLILALGTPAAREAKDAVAGTNVPVVFVPVFDPVRSGLVENLVKPGGNLTGIRTGGNIAKILEIQLAIDPYTDLIFVPHNPVDNASVQSLAELASGAADLGIELVVTEVSTDEELSAALADVPESTDFLFLLTSGFLLSRADKFVESALQNRISISSSSRGAKDGLLFGYETDRHQFGLQVSKLVNKILQGSSPADIPVETAESKLSVNLRVGAIIGVEIPQTILSLVELVVR